MSNFTVYGAFSYRISTHKSGEQWTWVALIRYERGSSYDAARKMGADAGFYYGDEEEAYEGGASYAEALIDEEGLDLFFR